jgi:NitT/TauT family transport system permease protein
VSGVPNAPARLTRAFGATAIVLLLAGWEFAGRSSDIVRLLISRPSLIASYFAAHSAEAARAAFYTGMESFAGLLVATAVGLSFAALFVYRPLLASIAYPWLVASQIIPLVCLAPLIILVFGPGPGGKVVLSALVAFFPIVTNLVTGIRNVPRAQLELMQIMAAPRPDTIRYVIVPFCLPLFFAALRTSAPFAVIGAIVAEFNGAEQGIGKDIFIAAKRLEPEVLMIGLFSAAALSGLLYGLILLLERCLGDWYWER